MTTMGLLLIISQFIQLFFYCLQWYLFYTLIFVGLKYNDCISYRERFHTLPSSHHINKTNNWLIVLSLLFIDIRKFLLQRHYQKGTSMSIEIEVLSQCLSLMVGFDFRVDATSYRTDNPNNSWLRNKNRQYSSLSWLS